MDDGSKDGEESGEDQPNVRVTRLQLDEKETAAGVFERGGGETVEGIICRTDYWRGDVVCCLSFMYRVKKRSNIQEVIADRADFATPTGMGQKQSRF